jgi:hypothetical protein
MWKMMTAVTVIALQYKGCGTHCSRPGTRPELGRCTLGAEQGAGCMRRRPGMLAYPWVETERARQMDV